MVWYPLGRPVGTTIYPGMQFTAVYIKRFLLDSWSLNDICCYIPAWFGAAASILVGLLTYECTIPENSSSSLLEWIVALVQGESKEKTGKNNGWKPETLGSRVEASNRSRFEAVFHHSRPLEARFRAPGPAGIDPG